MEHLSALDAGFLEVEDADPHISMAIGGIAVLTGPAPDFDALIGLIADRITAEPRLRQVLRIRPWDLSAPEWVDDPAFDITHHVHRVAVPRPGNDAALHRLTADIMGHRLDRNRPLWESWVIEGLAQNRWAVLTKIHHCMADGVSAARMLGRLFDEAGGLRVVSPAAPTPANAPSLSLNPLRWMNSAWRTSTEVANVAVQAVHGAAEIAGGLIRPAASTLNGPVSDMRRFALAEVSMADVDKGCARFGVTVNDVALAAITDSFRSMLINRGETPRRTSLRTLVPVSLRGSATDPRAGDPDDRVAAMLPYLPVDLPDPLQQLQTVHRRLTTAKNSGQREASSIFVSAANLIPFAMSAWTVRAFSRLPQRGVVTLATNVPGPRHRLQIMGREVVRLAPIPPLGAQLRTAVAILSYADHLAFGILADYDHAPDVDDLASGIARAVTRLAELSAVPHRSTALGTLALVVG